MFMNDIFGEQQKTELATELDNDRYYEVLGCDPKSSTEQIVAEYRNRARQLHPDKCSDEPEIKLQMEKKFCLLQRAKEVLTDPVKRQDYDKWRNSGLRVSYQKWMSIGANKLHCSMHWMSAGKKQPALTDDPTNKQSETEQNQLNADPKMSVQFNRDSVCNSNKSLLHQFRNYQI